MYTYNGPPLTIKRVLFNNGVSLNKVDIAEPQDTAAACRHRRRAPSSPSRTIVSILL